MPIERTKIEKSLSKKGFVPAERAKHRYFHHEVNGKRTGFSTFVSRGTGYKTIDDSLLRSMKQQLGLDSTKQVRDLFECPMTGEAYAQALRGKGLL
jgi:hypothetical protein